MVYGASSVNRPVQFVPAGLLASPSTVERAVEPVSMVSWIRHNILWVGLGAVVVFLLMRKRRAVRSGWRNVRRRWSNRKK